MGHGDDNAPSRRRWRLVLASGIAGAVTLVSGCGSEPDEGGTDGAGADSGSSTASSSSSTATDLREWLIRSDDLPGTWRSSESPGSGFRQEVCGVDIEPTAPEDHEEARFSQGGLGPFLAQHVRLHSSEQTPQEVVTQLTKALPGCTEYTTDGGGSGPSATFTVEELTVDGLPSHAVAWRQTATEGAKVTTDMVLVAKGKGLVAFVSYALKEEADPQAMTDAVAAFDGKSLS